jgi:serine protease Do
MKGEVIGINTAINPRANTIGFAVPINMAKSILPQLRTTGHVTRGWLGVVIQRITPELSESFGLEGEEGALVSKVMPDGPADEAGIEHGDVIVEFDGQEIHDWNDLPRGTPVGKKVKVVVLRDGERETLKAAVAELEEPRQEIQLAEKGGATEFGLRVQNLTPDLAEQLGGAAGGCDPRSKPLQRKRRAGPARAAGRRRRQRAAADPTRRRHDLRTGQAQGIGNSGSPCGGRRRA